MQGWAQHFTLPLGSFLIQHYFGLSLIVRQLWPYKGEIGNVVATVVHLFFEVAHTRHTVRKCCQCLGISRRVHTLSGWVQLMISL